MTNFKSILRNKNLMTLFVILALALPLAACGAASSNLQTCPNNPNIHVTDVKYCPSGSGSGNTGNTSNTGSTGASSTPGSTGGSGDNITVPSGPGTITGTVTVSANDIMIVDAWAATIGGDSWTGGGVHAYGPGTYPYSITDGKYHIVSSGIGKGTFCATIGQIQSKGQADNSNSSGSLGYTC